ncbi:MAG: transcription antitermination factor NusB [Chitinivibrionales bacterium]|nr:transcription antitermination factor NusB [Chitinivibrionales bacterium]
MLNRRIARVVALQALYACEIAGEDAIETTLDYVARMHECDEDQVKYAHYLLKIALQEIESLDEDIRNHTANWALDRISAIDRNILRLALCELRCCSQDAPFKVVIDEAVEIAKEYGSPDSGKFVNGIIDSVYKAYTKSDIRKESTADGTNAQKV